MELNSAGSLGAAVRAARRAAKLSQQELAARAGMSRVSVAHLEAGESNPTWETVLRVTSALGMNLDATWDPDAVPAQQTPPPVRRRGPDRTGRARAAKVPAAAKAAKTPRRSAMLSGSGQLTAQVDLAEVLARTAKNR
jgi:transcriptional regulator with XRE-family HTH domain